MNHATLIISPLLFLFFSACNGNGINSLNSLSVVKFNCDLIEAAKHKWYVSSSGDEIQIFGDSNGQGFTSCDTSETSGVTTGYALPLARKIDMTLDNKAIGGSEIVSQHSQVLKYGQRYTDIKIIHAGHNDVYFKTELSKYKNLLRESIEIMSQNARLVVVGTTTKYTAISGMGPSNPLTLDYRNATVEVVDELALPNVVLVDIYNMFSPDLDKYVKDAIHYNKKGSDEISDIFLQTILSN